MNAPPYRLETERLVVRCWQPADAPLLKEAIDSSLDHLRPWMDWAKQEPQPIAQKVEALRRWRGRFDLGQDFVFGLFSRDEKRVLGGSGLHTRLGEYALEIGYWVRADSIARGLANEATAALTWAAFVVAQVKRIEIHCAPDNLRSAAIPANLGYTHEATLRQRLRLNDDSWLDTMIWTLFAEDFPATPSARVAVRAYDAAGSQIMDTFASPAHG